MGLLRTALKVVAALAFLTLVSIVFFGPGYVERSRNGVKAHAPYLISDRAQALHDSLIIGDWRADSLLWNRNLAKRGAYGQLDLPRLIEGHVAVQVFTAIATSPAGPLYDGNKANRLGDITPLIIAQLWPIRTWASLFERAIYQAEKLANVQKTMPDRLKIIRTVADLDTLLARRMHGEKIAGALLGLASADALDGDMSNLQRLESAGYRLINVQSHADTRHNTPTTGLTEFGRRLVKEVQRRGLILDLAGSSRAVVKDVLDMADMPLVLSTTGLRSACDLKNDIPVKLMQRIAATGGVIGIGYWQGPTCDNSPAGIAQRILAATETLGADAVSLGSNFDGSKPTTFDISELAALTQELLKLGMEAADIRKVMGENMMRVIHTRLEQRP